MKPPWPEGDTGQADEGGCSHTDSALLSVDPHVPSLHPLYPMSFYKSLGGGMKLGNMLPPDYESSFWTIKCLFSTLVWPDTTPEEVKSS